MQLDKPEDKKHLAARTAPYRARRTEASGDVGTAEALRARSEGGAPVVRGELKQRVSLLLLDDIE